MLSWPSPEASAERECALCTKSFMVAGSSARSWKPAMLSSENISATSCSENLHIHQKDFSGLYAAVQY